MGERTDASAKLNQARMIFDLVNQIVSRMEVRQEVCVFVLRLLDLAGKSKTTFTRADTRYFLNTIDFVSRTAAKKYPDLSETVDRTLASLKA